MGGIKRGDGNTAVSRISSTFIAFSSPYLWVKKSNSPRDDRGVYQSNEVIRCEVEHTPEDFIDQENKLAENLTHLASVEKQ